MPIVLAVRVPVATVLGRAAVETADLVANPVREGVLRPVAAALLVDRTAGGVPVPGAEEFRFTPDEGTTGLGAGLDTEVSEVDDSSNTLTCEGRTKTPWFGVASKYLVP